ncbi:tripartite motif-containing protein 3-like [Saccostrea cucullata]|uniref:tripartite motif-containing protein 3-like n=1 Tax=Saccostrea cuccullata TaxID=36930 RepID=UPI002ED57537
MADERSFAQHFIQCDECEEEPAKQYCKNCKGNLCTICTMRHQEKKLTQNHELISLISERKNRKPEFSSCEAHPSRNLEFYCKPCHTPLCPECLITDHNGHKMEDLMIVYNQTMNNLSSNQEKVFTSLRTSESHLSKAKLLKTQLVANADAVVAKIEKRADAYIEIIHKTREKFVDFVRKHEREHTGHIDKIIAKREEEIAKLKRMKSDIEVKLASDTQQTTFLEDTFIDKKDDCQLLRSSDFTLIEFEIPHISENETEEAFGKLSHIPCKDEPFNLGSTTCSKRETEEPQLTMSITSRFREQYDVHCRGEMIFITGEKRNIQQFDNLGRHISAIETESPPDGMTILPNMSIFYSDFFGKKIVHIHPEKNTREMILTDMYPYGLHNTRANEILACLVFQADSEARKQKGKIIKYSKSGEQLQEYMYDGQTLLFNRPIDVTENITDDIIVSDVHSCQVIAISPEGHLQFQYDGGVYVGKSNSFSPAGLDTDILGNIMIADEYGNRIHVLDSEGNFKRILLNRWDGIELPVGICFDGKDSVWIAESKSKKSKKFKYLE